jgi:mannitol-1-/sugar-/sorbitol-6-phosphatase
MACHQHDSLGQQSAGHAIGREGWRTSGLVGVGGVDHDSAVLRLSAGVDGVLVDSTAAVEEAWTRFATRHGLDPQHMIANCHGRRTIDLIRLVAPHLDADVEATRIEREEVGTASPVRALPGARELLQTIPANRFAVVTSGARRLAVARLQAAGLPLPAVLVTADDVEKGKPDPTGYLSAAAQLGVEPPQSLVIEDSPAGVTAALSAGMTVIAVLTTTDASSLRAAHRRVPNLSALLPATPSHA